MTENIVIHMDEWLARKAGFESVAELEDHMADQYHELWMVHVREERLARKLERARQRP
jgi:hypothetical protein